MSLEARVPSVVVQIGGTTVPISSVTLSHGINEPPRLTMVAQVENADARQTGKLQFGDSSIDLNRFNVLNRLVQQKLLNHFTLEPDVIVIINDGEEGEGHTIKFRGYLGQPDFAVQNGQLLLTLNALHVMVAMQAFSGNIYQSVEKYARQVFQDYFSSYHVSSVRPNPIAEPGAMTFDPDNIKKLASEILRVDANAPKPEKNNSIASRIKAITQGLHARYVTNRKTHDMDPLIVPMFQLNTHAMAYVLDTLNRSEALTVIDPLTLDGFSDTNLHITLYEHLLGNANFLDFLRAMTHVFVLQLNATWDGASWLEHNFTAEPPGVREISAALESIRFSMGDMFNIPVAQVIVQGGGSEFYALSGSYTDDNHFDDESHPSGPVMAQAPVFGQDFFNGNNILKGLAAYPDKPVVSAGRFVVVAAPRWVNSDAYLIKDIRSGAVKIPGPDPVGRFASTVKSTRVQRNIAGMQEKTRRNILDYYAEKIFKDLYLQGSTAMVTIPFNVKVQVGRTYKMRSITGESVFDAYLSNVTHNVVIDPGGGGVATTTLMFTHVRVDGVKLRADGEVVPTIRKSTLATNAELAANATAKPAPPPLPPLPPPLERVHPVRNDGMPKGFAAPTGERADGQPSKLKKFDPFGNPLSKPDKW